MVKGGWQARGWASMAHQWGQGSYKWQRSFLQKTDRWPKWAQKKGTKSGKRNIHWWSFQTTANNKSFSKCIESRKPVSEAVGPLGIKGKLKEDIENAGSWTNSLHVFTKNDAGQTVLPKPPFSGNKPEEPSQIGTTRKEVLLCIKD